MSDLLTWLGPAADQLTAEQLERFEAEADAATERIGDDPDDQEDRDAVLSAITQYLLGETTIDEAGEQRRATHDAARLASLAAQAIARLAVQDGMSESEAGRRASLDRMTVRKILGK